jgi:hypothetical protein
MALGVAHTRMGQARVRRVQTFKGALEAPQARSPSRWSSTRTCQVLRGGRLIQTGVRDLHARHAELCGQPDHPHTAAADGVAPRTERCCTLLPLGDLSFNETEVEKILNGNAGASGCRTAAPLPSLASCSMLPRTGQLLLIHASSFLTTLVTVKSRRVEADLCALGHVIVLELEELSVKACPGLEVRRIRPCSSRPLRSALGRSPPSLLPCTPPPTPARGTPQESHSVSPVTSNCPCICAQYWDVLQGLATDT